MSTPVSKPSQWLKLVLERSQRVVYKIFNRTGVCLFTSWRKSFPHSRFVYLSHKQDCTWGMKQKQGLPSSVNRVKLLHESIKSTEHSQATSLVLPSLTQVYEPREVHVWIGDQLLFLETHSPVDAQRSLGLGPAASSLLFPQCWQQHLVPC